ncbi:MAG: 30S ribosomal protein S6 [Acidobacteriota bacterium]
MRGYELMYIVDPTLDEQASKALISQIEDFMTKQGVNVEGTDPWGKRRLAYRIGKHWEGTYVLSRIQAEPHSVAEVERRLRVMDGVLRFITVRLDEEQEKIERRRARKAAREQTRRERRGQPGSPAPETARVGAPEREAAETSVSAPDTGNPEGSDQKGQEGEAGEAGEAR